MKKILLVLITLSLMLVINTAGASDVVFAADNLDCQYLEGSNINYNSTGDDGYVVTSYLTRTNDGYMRLQGCRMGSKKAPVAVYYDSDFRLVSRKTIDIELPIFGGFYESDSNYFIISGQSNPEESDDVEVIRITKYDKNWNRIKSAGLYGANTRAPFYAGNCRMDMDGKYMLIRTAHSMYKTEYDGLSHQANMTIQVDTDKMVVTDHFSEISNLGHGYVSHSFNQFIKVIDHKIVAADHGDHSPRGFVLTMYPKDLTDGIFHEQYGWVDSVMFMRIPDYNDYNYTGSGAGAFEVSDTSYLFAGHTLFKDTDDISAFDNRTMNVFISAVDRDTHTVTTHWLTDYKEGETTARAPAMVKTGDDRYLVLWGRGNKVEYTFIDGNGNKVGETYTMEGYLSDCAPIIDKGSVVWYTWYNSEETFYRIPINDPGNPEVIEAVYDHDFEYQKTEDGLATFKCKKCGEIKTGKVPTDFEPKWTIVNNPSQYWSYSFSMDVNEIAVYLAGAVKYSAESENKFDEMAVEFSDPEHSEWTRKGETAGWVSFTDTGTYMVTVYPKYNPEIRRTVRIRVTKPFAGVELQADEVSPQPYGSEITLKAVADGGRGDIQYRFSCIDEEGAETVLQDTEDDTCKWKATHTGSYTLRVEATDQGDADASVMKDDLSMVIEKAAVPEVVPASEYGVSYAVERVTNDLLSDAPGWEFDVEDIGKELTPDVPLMTTAHYTADDKDNYETVSMQITVTRINCNHDGEKEVRNAVEPTCTSVGETGDEYCTLCGYLLRTSTPVSKKPHDYVGTVLIPSTCTAKGVIGYECKVCRDFYTEELPLDPNNHAYVVTIPPRPATATEEGTTGGRVCISCDEYLEYPERIPAIGGKSSSKTGGKTDKKSKVYAKDKSTVSAKQAEIEANNGIVDPSLPKVKISKPKAAKKSMTAKWKKLKKKQQKVVKGIEVEYSLTSDFRTPVFKAIGKKKAKVKIKKLVSKKTYYVRAHTYVVRNGQKYVSNWSAVKKVKIK